MEKLLGRKLKLPTTLSRRCKNVPQNVLLVPGPCALWCSMRTHYSNVDMALLKFILTHAATGRIFKCKDASQCAKYLGVSTTVIYAKMNSTSNITMNGYTVQKIHKPRPRSDILEDEFGEYKEVVVREEILTRFRVGEVNVVGDVDLSVPFEHKTRNLSSDSDRDRRWRYENAQEQASEFEDLIFKKEYRNDLWDDTKLLGDDTVTKHSLHCETRRDCVSPILSPIDERDMLSRTTITGLSPELAKRVNVFYDSHLPMYNSTYDKA